MAESENKEGIGGWTYGFYDSIDHDRTYTAEQFSKIFEGIINDGVFGAVGNHLQVAPAGAMTISIDSGRAWFDGTWSDNQAFYYLDIEASNLILDRIDAIVLEVNKEPSMRKNTLKVITGFPASTPQRPELEDSEFIHQHALAYIRIPAGAEEVKASYITNIIGTEEAPFITGILETMATDLIVAQWDGEFHEWLTTNQEEYYEWLSMFTKIEQVLWKNWFDGIKGQLTEDAATHLQSQIDKITNVYAFDETLYMPNSFASVTSDGTLVLGGFMENPKEEEENE